jgi:methionyl-tRNA formyltransferase
MLTVSFAIYRQWGFDIFKNIYEYQKLRGDFEIGAVIACKEYQFEFPEELKKEVNFNVVDPGDTEKIYKIFKKHKTDLACMYSWSYFVKEPLLSKFICLCLHPSLVPQNRGGTPIQNQILAGQNDSGLSLFRMEEGMDTGPVYKQCVMSLMGNINDIFSRMTDLGSSMTKDLISDYINGTLKFTPQINPTRYPPLKRRKSEESEIKLEDLPETAFNDLNNLVRGLLDPYPNAFFIRNGKKYLVRGVEKFPDNPGGLSFKIKDGWVKITDHSIEA